jgi:hypothetical protein
MNLNCDLIEIYLSNWFKDVHKIAFWMKIINIRLKNVKIVLQIYFLFNRFLR